MMTRDSLGVAPGQPGPHGQAPGADVHRARHQPALGLADRRRHGDAAARRPRRHRPVPAQRPGRRRLARDHRQHADLGHRPDPPGPRHRAPGGQRRSERPGRPRRRSPARSTRSARACSPPRTRRTSVVRCSAASPPATWRTTRPEPSWARTRAVNRTVADGVTIRVDADATAVFGAAGDDVFSHLADLSTALRAGDQAGIQAGIDHMNKDLDRLATASRRGRHPRRPRRGRRPDRRGHRAAPQVVALDRRERRPAARSSSTCRCNRPRTKPPSLATSRVMQPSLLDFLK